MSANNYLLIEQCKSGFMISEVDVEGGGFVLRDKPFKTLEEAIKHANKYMEKNNVEYGLHIQI